MRGQTVLLGATLSPEEETQFWLQASQTSLDEVWDNSADDVYAQLLER